MAVHAGTNDFMIQVLRPWVEAGSGDEWGEYMSSMLETAECTCYYYDEVAEFLWRRVLAEVILMVEEFLPEYGSPHQRTLARQAAQGLRGLLDYVIDENGGNLFSTVNAEIMREVFEALPAWMMSEPAFSEAFDWA